MARNRIIPRTLAIYYVIFVLLLAIRLIADLTNFPYDGYIEVSIPAVVEYLVFYVVLHYGLCLLFRYNKISHVQSGLYALLTMAMYIFIHFFEYFFYAGGRVMYYPPNENFWINILTAFLYTQDAGFWQVMRIFSCGALVFALVVNKKGLSVKLIISMLIFYLWGMLLTHPYVWLYMPQESTDVPGDIIRQGGFIYLIAMYALSFLVSFSFIDIGGKYNTLENYSVSYLGLWFFTFISLSFFYPQISNFNITLSLIMVLSIILIHSYLFIWIEKIKVRKDINWIGVFPGITGLILVIFICIQLLPNIYFVISILVLTAVLQYFFWKNVTLHPKLWAISTSLLTGTVIYL